MIYIFTILYKQEEVNKQTTIVKEQVPKVGIMIKRGSKIHLKYGILMRKMVEN